MSEEQQLWQYIVGEQQLGPITAEQFEHLAASGDITPETFVWTDGLEEWIPASSVEGLFPDPVVQPHRPHLLVGAEAQAAHPLGSHVPVVAAPQQPVAQPYQQPLAAAPAAQALPLQGGVAPQPQQYVPGAVQPVGAVPGMAPVGALGVVGAAPPGTDYPPTNTIKPARFGWILWTFLGAVACYSGAIGLLIAQSTGGMASLMIGLYAAGAALGLWSSIIALIYLHRGWSCLKYGAPSTTPGKAVWLLFVPFFNFYWIFVAYAKFPKDWNRIMSSHPNLQHGPRLGEANFLIYAISSIVFAPVAIIMHFMVYAQLCKAINFMATRHLLPQPGMPQPAAPGGIRLY